MNKMMKDLQSAQFHRETKQFKGYSQAIYIDKINIKGFIARGKYDKVTNR